MTGRTTSFIALVALASGCASSTSLFNGKNLDGWVIENNGQFSVRNGLLFVNKGTGWLRSEAQYDDFTLHLEFRFLEKRANSGIFVRTGPTSNDDENGWPNNGYQVQCMDVVEHQFPIGSMIQYGPPFTSESDREMIAKAYRPQGEWNTYDITCKGEEITVKLNRLVVTRASQITNRSGHVGIQGEKGLLEFRNIRVTQLE